MPRTAAKGGAPEPLMVGRLAKSRSRSMAGTTKPALYTHYWILTHSPPIGAHTEPQHNINRLCQCRNLVIQWLPTSTESSPNWPGVEGVSTWSSKQAALRQGAPAAQPSCGPALISAHVCSPARWPVDPQPWALAIFYNLLPH